MPLSRHDVVRRGLFSVEQRGSVALRPQFIFLAAYASRGQNERNRVP